MFTWENRYRSPWQFRTRAVSILAHAGLLVWLLRPAGPQVLTPSSVAAGNYGSVIAHIYWPTQFEDGGGGNAMNAKKNALVRQRLIWKKAHRSRSSPPPSEPAPAAARQAANTESSAPATPAGRPYGTADNGSLFGDEILPALPLRAIDPVIGSSDLAGHAEGSVVVEITIDDRGNIVQKTVLQSLGPAIDAKVLAALENWHFRPATRNGIPISSKQDVYYHFRPPA